MSFFVIHKKDPNIQWLLNNFKTYEKLIRRSCYYYNAIPIRLNSDMIPILVSTFTQRQYSKQVVIPVYYANSALRNQYDGSRSFLYNIVKEQHEHFSWETGKVYYLGVNFENGIQIEIIPNKYVDYKYQVVCIDLSQNNRLSTNTRTLRSIRKFRNDVVNKNN